MSLLLLCVAIGAVAGSARASEDPVDARGASQEPFIDWNALPAEESFLRARAVLDHFGVPAEADVDSQLLPYQRIQSLQNLQALLPVFDPHGEVSRFFRFDSDQLTCFQDPGAWQVQDFRVSFSNPGQDDSLAQRLARARASELPLQGLKVALDPGHMGGQEWDDPTGKWVEDAHGNRLSEGVINLQTAMLVEERLSQLGAQVMITRRGLRPVTDVDYATFDVHAAGLDALREAQLTSWFTSLLASAPAGSALFSAFAGNADFRNLFSPSNKATYFNQTDLQARVDAIEAFQPDITLILHYDAAVHAVSTDAPFTHDATKVYVPGAYDAIEFASRQDRADFVKHVTDEVPFRASVALAHQVVTTLSHNLKIPFDRQSPGSVKEIEPGLFARNLYLLKRHRKSATAYVESLFYNDSGEFAAISNATHPMTIDGESHPYSDRLALVADSVTEAVVKFVKAGF